MVQLCSGRLYVAEEDELAGPFNPDAPLITTFYTTGQQEREIEKEFQARLKVKQAEIDAW